MQESRDLYKVAFTLEIEEELDCEFAVRISDWEAISADWDWDSLFTVSNNEEKEQSGKSISDHFNHDINRLVIILNYVT